MNDLSALPYPGENATPQELLDLADQYRLAFETLAGPGAVKQMGGPIRLIAIHGIELYLQALLRLSGEAPTVVRGFQHNLANMADHPTVVSMKLKRRTIEHLRTMVDAREYLVVRYAPDMKACLSEINRLGATLNELSTKVGQRFAVYPQR